MNQASSAIYFSGRTDRATYRAAVVERLAAAYGEDWWFDTVLSFVYHETGRFEASRRLSERSLAGCPANANASHNIAHVCLETLDHDGGTAFLAEWLRSYDRGAPYHCHLAWHLALFELHRGHADRALVIHQRDIAPARNVRHALMDGPALLWRFSLYESPVGPPPWRALADLGRQAVQPGFAFGDIHAALADAGDGDERSLTAIVDSPRALHGKGQWSGRSTGWAAATRSGSSSRRRWSSATCA